MNETPSLLRRFVRPKTDIERCDLCSAELGPEHPHLLEPASRQIHCSCDICAILFDTAGATRYKRVPRDVKFLPNFRMSDAQWTGLNLPIQLAFFFHSSPDERLVALYPGPAGAMESTLSLDTWSEIESDNPHVAALLPDVEALLVNRVGQHREYFIAPIDKCYELVGLLRAKWHGLSGGTEAWKAIDGFFSDLKTRASVPSEVQQCSI